MPSAALRTPSSISSPRPPQRRTLDPPALTRSHARTRLANIRPSGEYLMEDFYYAAGLRGLLSRLGDAPLDRATVGGRAMGETLTGVYKDDVIRPLDDPAGRGRTRRVARQSGPDGCVKSTPPQTLVAQAYRTGRGLRRLRRPCQADDPNLKVDAGSVLVLRGTGPIGAPGMPEWGCSPSQEASRTGVRDMVRISDARMSGTAYGTCVLHVAPESHVGGPLALVERRR